MDGPVRGRIAAVGQAGVVKTLDLRVRQPSANLTLTLFDQAFSLQPVHIFTPYAPRAGPGGGEGLPTPLPAAGTRHRSAGCADAGRSRENLARPRAASA